MDIQKSEAKSETIRNQAEYAQVGEELFPLKVVGIAGAGDLD